MGSRGSGGYYLWVRCWVVAGGEEVFWHLWTMVSMLVPFWTKMFLEGLVTHLQTQGEQGQDSGAGLVAELGEAVDL